MYSYSRRRYFIALTRAFWFDKIKNTMVGLIQRRPTIFKRQEKWVVDVNCVCDATDGVYIFLQFIIPPIIVCFPERNGGSHPAAHFCVFWICNITNNGAPIKYITKPLYHIYNQYVFKIYPTHFPLGGDTPFYLISRRNRRFLFDG